MKLSLFFITILFFFTNCQKVFHAEDISVGKITNYSQLVSAIGGVYGKLVIPIYNRNEFYLVNLNGDDMNKYAANYDYYYDYQFNSNCYQAGENLTFDMTNYWKEMYSTIVSANNIIVQYNPISINDISTKGILGESYLIRAYCYFRLTRTFGQVPIIDNIDINYNVSKPSYSDIYKYIESDLKIGHATVAEK